MSQDPKALQWSGAIDTIPTTHHLLQALVARGHEPADVLAGVCDWIDELVKLRWHEDAAEEAAWTKLAADADAAHKALRPGEHDVP